MKKFIIAVSAAVILIIISYQAFYRLGIYIDLHPNASVTTFMKTDETTIYMEKDGEYVPFEIRGVDIGVGIPGEWATEFTIDKETYLRWFAMIQEMGANTIRNYTIHHQDFYDAYYEYNTQREKNGQEPLYMLHGLWVNDYILFSHRDAFDSEFIDVFMDDCKKLIDVIHGNITLPVSGEGLGSGDYRKDISKWVIGYILGVEWEDYTVVYTDQNSADKAGFSGTYLYTTEDATPFETMLAQVGNKAIEYESERYKEQRLVAFANWPTTDPFVYPIGVYIARSKSATVNVEHIKCNSDTFISGLFASYHVYSYYPDYLEIMRDTSKYTWEDLKDRMGDVVLTNMEYRLSKIKGPKIEDYLSPENYIDANGNYNTYLAYLNALTAYHTIPVVISEYGTTTGRGMAQVDRNTGRNQGHMTEAEQGQGIVDCYRDIMEAGCAGSCVFSWQDEWFKRTWNTMHAIDLDNTAYWSDYQTNEQYFGLLTFDPGEERSVCYVDGDLSEWTEDDLVIRNGSLDLSMKYDEKFIYFLAHKESFDQENDTIYIPIDTNPKVGSTYAKDQGAAFERAVDFLLVISGRESSRLLVQKRYECLRAIYGGTYYGVNPYYFPPDIDDPSFHNIHLALILEEYIPDYNVVNGVTGESYETGLLRYGNANPDDPNFDSLSDYIFSEDYVEIRIPWELLNFSNPSEMMIHDDYYECYGIENLHIDSMYVGIESADNLEYRIPMAEFPLEGWGKDVTYHERLKKSYYIIQEYWTGLDQQ